MKKGIFFAAALSATPEHAEEVQRSIDEVSQVLSKLKPDELLAVAFSAASVGARMVRNELSKAGPEGEISGCLGEKGNTCGNGV